MTSFSYPWRSSENESVNVLYWTSLTGWGMKASSDAEIAWLNLSPHQGSTFTMCFNKELPFPQSGVAPAAGLWKLEQIRWRPQPSVQLNAVIYYSHAWSLADVFLISIPSPVSKGKLKLMLHAFIPVLMIQKFYHLLRAVLQIHELDAKCAWRID